MRDLFPMQLSYNCFIELVPRVAVEMMPFIQLFFFGRTTGLSPQKHIQRHTISKAKHLLLTTSLRINEIALALGFQQPQNFTNWFKKQEGVSPNGYRKK